MVKTTDQELEVEAQGEHQSHNKPEGSRRMDMDKIPPLESLYSSRVKDEAEGQSRGQRKNLPRLGGGDCGCHPYWVGLLSFWSFVLPRHNLFSTSPISCYALLYVVSFASCSRSIRILNAVAETERLGASWLAAPL